MINRFDTLGWIRSLNQGKISKQSVLCILKTRNVFLDFKQGFKFRIFIKFSLFLRKTWNAGQFSSNLFKMTKLPSLQFGTKSSGLLLFISSPSFSLLFSIPKCPIILWNQRFWHEINFSSIQGYKIKSLAIYEYALNSNAQISLNPQRIILQKMRREQDENEERGRWGRGNVKGQALWNVKGALDDDWT